MAHKNSTDRTRMKVSADSPLSIQNVLGGGRPGGGLQARTKDDPSLTTTGSKTSLGHSGASEGQLKVLELVILPQNILRVTTVPHFLCSCHISQLIMYICANCSRTVIHI